MKCAETKYNKEEDMSYISWHLITRVAVGAKNEKNYLVLWTPAGCSTLGLVATDVLRHKQLTHNRLIIEYGLISPAAA